MRNGVRLGVDVGTVRIGIAVSDPAGILATPLETVDRDGDHLARIGMIATDLGVIEIVVGLPLALSGRETASTADARTLAEGLVATGTSPVRLVDERLSTVTASSALRASGRTSRTSRSVIDQVAAVIILQHALDVERISGGLPGSLVTSSKDPDDGG